MAPPGQTIFGVSVNSPALLPVNLIIPVVLNIILALDLIPAIGIYGRLPVPGTELSPADSLAYVLKYVLPLGVLWQIFIFEYYALFRITAGKSAFNQGELDPNRAWGVVAMQRVSVQSLEQLVVTTCLCAAASLYFDASTCYDQRFAVVNGVLYIIGRPIYALGYGYHEQMRAPGLFLGNFWTNGALALYLCLRMFGVEDNKNLLIALYWIIPLIIFVALFVCLGQQPKAGDLALEEEDEEEDEE